MEGWEEGRTNDQSRISNLDQPPHFHLIQQPTSSRQPSILRSPIPLTRTPCIRILDISHLKIPVIASRHLPSFRIDVHLTAPPSNFPCRWMK